MRVVVTGGTGRAGQWVVRLLAEAGHEVVNFDVADRPELELPGEFCRVDLTNAGKVSPVSQPTFADRYCTRPAIKVAPTSTHNNR